jgi:hypothetical protein
VPDIDTGAPERGAEPTNPSSPLTVRVAVSIFAATALMVVATLGVEGVLPGPPFQDPQVVAYATNSLAPLGPTPSPSPSFGLIALGPPPSPTTPGPMITGVPYIPVIPTPYPAPVVYTRPAPPKPAPTPAPTAIPAPTPPRTFFGHGGRPPHHGFPHSSRR